MYDYFNVETSTIFVDMSLIATELLSLGLIVEWEELRENGKKTGNVVANDAEDDLCNRNGSWRMRIWNKSLTSLLSMKIN